MSDEAEMSAQIVRLQNECEDALALAGRYKTALEEALPEIESYVRDSAQKRARGKTRVEAVLRSLRDVLASGGGTEG